MSMKGSDASCIPLCPTCHDMFDGRRKTPAGEVGREAFIRYYGVPVADVVLDLNYEWLAKTGKRAA